jgi:hypothetical protein
MFKHIYFLAAALCITALQPFPLFSKGISPPLEISTVGTGNSPVAVSGTTNSFMVTWVDESANVWTSFSNDNGATWRYTAAIPDASSLNFSRISQGSSGTMVVYVHSPPGAVLLMPTAGFSTNNGQTWSLNTIASKASSFVNVCTTGTSFMAVFSTINRHLYSSFSSDGTSWNSDVQIAPADSVLLTYSPGIAYNGSVFMTAWVNNDADRTALFSTSTNNGSTWSAHSQIGSIDQVNSEISLTAVESGFLATWSDTSGRAWSSFTSNNGSTWSTPSLITSGLSTESYPSVLANGSSTVFIAAWKDSANTAYACFSTNNGATWSSPLTAISPTGAYLPSLLSNFVGVSVVGTNGLFTWIDTNQNIYANYSSLNPTGSGISTNGSSGTGLSVGGTSGSGVSF